MLARSQGVGAAMQSEYVVDLLDRYIDRLQVDASPRSIGVWPVDAQGGEPDEMISLLQMAVHLNAMRPGAGVPSASFTARLRSQMLSSAKDGSDYAGSGT